MGDKDKEKVEGDKDKEKDEDNKDDSGDGGDEDYNDEDHFPYEGDYSDEEETMNIFVMLPPGNTITLDVQPSNTIDHTKGQLCFWTSIPVKQQMLIFKNKPLKGGTLSDYNIKRNSVLHLSYMPEKPLRPNFCDIV